MLARQQVMQHGTTAWDCGDGWARLKELKWLGWIPVAQAHLVSREGIRRSMISFAYQRELEPVNTAFDNISGLTMQPLTWESNPSARNPTHQMSRAHNHDRLTSTPVPYEAYLQQGDAMAVGGDGNPWDWMQGDGRERGSGPKKRQKNRLRILEFTTARCQWASRLHKTDSVRVSVNINGRKN